MTRKYTRRKPLPNGDASIQSPDLAPPFTPGVFVYIGDPNHGGEGPDKTTLYGVEFPKGEPVQVEDKEAARRLSSNSHFKAG